MLAPRGGLRFVAALFAVLNCARSGPEARNEPQPGAPSAGQVAGDPRRGPGVAEKRRPEPNPSSPAAPGEAPAGAAFRSAASIAEASEAAAPSGPREVRDLGPLRFPPSIRGRDGGYSARWRGRVVWNFGDTTLAHPAHDGEIWRSSTHCFMRDEDVARCEDPLDARGAPLEFLPFLPEELAFNATHFSVHAKNCRDDCGARYALWPAAMVPAPGTDDLLVFYSRVFARPGAFNFQSEWSSIAVWSDPEQRPRRRAGPLFRTPEPPFGAAAFLHEGFLYAYGCQCERIPCPCYLGRVIARAAETRSEWRFWDGQGWHAEVGKARTVLHASAQLSVLFDERRRMWSAVYVPPFSAGLWLRWAPAPEGPWSARRLLAKTQPSNRGEPIYCGLMHPELGRDGRQLLSYFRPTEPFAGEIRLLDVPWPPLITPSASDTVIDD